MLASGVPVRNGHKHAAEMADLAIHTLTHIDNFPIPHIPGEQLQLRIGMHSGPCVAGLTGSKTPRYLLFGQTVNIASIIEALGLPMFIHVSDSTACLLAKTPKFVLINRGKMDVKGYGTMETSWIMQ